MPICAKCQAEIESDAVACRVCEAVEALGSQTIGELRSQKASSLTAAGVIAKIGVASVAIPGAVGLLGILLVSFVPGNKAFESMAWSVTLALFALVTVLPCCLILAALVRKFSR
jgi:hypothetical protein